MTYRYSPYRDGKDFYYRILNRRGDAIAVAFVERHAKLIVKLMNRGVHATAALEEIRDNCQTVLNKRRRIGSQFVRTMLKIAADALAA